MIATALLAQEALNAGGWVLMILCIGFVCSLCAFCVWRLMREERPGEHHHAPLDINTHDVEA